MMQLTLTMTMLIAGCDDTAAVKIFNSSADQPVKY